MNILAPNIVSCPPTGRYHDSSQSPMRTDKVDENYADGGEVDSCQCGANRVGLYPPNLGPEQHDGRVRQESTLRYITPKHVWSEESGGQHHHDMQFFDLSALVDSHCHLQLDPLGAFSKSAIKLALEMGVGRIVVCGTEPGEDWRRLLALHQAHPEVVVPNFGLHPWWIKKYYPLSNDPAPGLSCTFASR